LTLSSATSPPKSSAEQGGGSNEGQDVESKTVSLLTTHRSNLEQEKRVKLETLLHDVTSVVDRIRLHSDAEVAPPPFHPTNPNPVCACRPLTARRRNLNGSSQNSRASARRSRQNLKAQRHPSYIPPPPPPVVTLDSSSCATHPNFWTSLLRTSAA
jgi:hypothetical protein